MSENLNDVYNKYILKNKTEVRTSAGRLIKFNKQ